MRNNTIFITGGTLGIGKASVIKFLQNDYNVVFMDINADQAQKLLEEVNDPDHLLFVKGDVKSKEDLNNALSLGASKFGGFNAVFANAGIHRKNTLLNISDEELDLVINTNIYGTVRTLQAAVPYLIKAGGGAVVISASDQSYIGKAESFAYGLSKGALGQIAKSLAIDLAKYNIRVNAICPGTIYTPLVDNLFNRLSEKLNVSKDELIAEENALYCRGRMGEASEVANLVYFLASDEASFCTGGNYLVDGGLVAQ